MKSFLEIHGMSYSYPAAKAPVLRDISLRIHAGECVCITGPSGCGKTTLLMAVQGLLKDGYRPDAVRIHPSGFGLDTGMVFQNADTQILCTTVRDETAFWPVNLGMPPDFIEDAVESALHEVGLAGFEARHVDALSAGQKHRLTIASVLSMRPGLILLDEPGAQLDAGGKEKLVRILKRLKYQGHALMIADHDLHPYRSVADGCVLMKNGGIDRTLTRIPLEYGMPDRLPESVPDHSYKTFGPPVVDVRDISLSGSEDRTVFDGLSLQVQQGEFVHLYGINGQGKSTLLRCLCGFARPDSGAIRTADVDSPRPHLLAGKAALLLQNPQKQIFEDTVFDEAAFSLKRSGLSAERIRERVMWALEFCEVRHLADRSPMMLSFGEQHRVALASVIAAEPRLLLLDEPFSGLDLDQRRRLLTLLRQLCRDRKVSIVMASHNPGSDMGCADRRLVLADGKITSESGYEC